MWTGEGVFPILPGQCQCTSKPSPDVWKGESQQEYKYTQIRNTIDRLQNMQVTKYANYKICKLQNMHGRCMKEWANKNTKKQESKDMGCMGLSIYCYIDSVTQR